MVDRRRPVSTATARAALASSLLVLVILAFPLLLGNVYFGLDLLRVDLGAICALKDQVRGGEIGGIARGIGEGLPLLVEPSAQIFYPLRWLVLPLPPEHAASVEAIIHLSLGAGAAVWLARTFRIRPFAAACAGIAFALSGTALNLIVHGYYQIGVLYVPLAWALARRWFGARPARWMPIALASALALSLLGGEPQTFLFACALLGFETVRFLFGRRKRGFVRSMYVVGAMAAGFGIGLVLWAGMLAEASLGFRTGEGIPLARAALWSISPDTWIGLVAPGVLAHAVRPGVSFTLLWSGDFGASMPESLGLWNTTPYLGPLLFAGVALSIVERRARPILVVFGAASILALGDTLPVFRVVQRILPAAARFRYPAKYLLIVTLAGVLLAAVSFDRAAKRRRRILLALGTALGAQAALWAWILIHRSDLDGLTSGLPFLDHPELPSLGEMLSGAVGMTLAPLGAALALASTPRLARFLSGALVADYLLALPGAIFVGPPMLPHRSPIAELFQADSKKTVLCHGRGAMTGLLAFDRAWSEWTSSLNDRLLEVPNVQACDGLSNAEPYSPLHSRTNARLVFELDRGRLSTARALGCTHVLAADPPLGARNGVLVAELAASAEIRPIGLWAIADPIPEVFAAVRPRRYDGELELMRAAVHAEDVDALLGLIDDPLHRFTGAMPEGARVGTLSVEWAGPGRATVHAVGDGGAVLGIRRAFHAGWRASQGGALLPVIRVGTSQVGAVVEDLGRGPVIFEYAYPAPGVAAAGALFGLVLLVLMGRRRHTGT